MTTRSGSMIRSRILASRYSGCRSRASSTDSATSRTAWWNSTSPGFLEATSSIKVSTYPLMVDRPPSGALTRPRLHVLFATTTVQAWRSLRPGRSARARQGRGPYSSREAKANNRLVALRIGSAGWAVAPVQVLLRKRFQAQHPARPLGQLGERGIERGDRRGQGSKAHPDQLGDLVDLGSNAPHLRQDLSNGRLDLVLPCGELGGALLQELAHLLELDGLGADPGLGPIDDLRGGPAGRCQDRSKLLLQEVRGLRLSVPGVRGHALDLPAVRLRRRLGGLGLLGLLCLLDIQVQPRGQRVRPVVHHSGAALVRGLRGRLVVGLRALLRLRGPCAGA